MEVCATDEINPNLSSAQVSRINGDHIEAIRCPGKQRESCSDWQNASVAEGRKRVPSDGLAAHPESLQSVLISGAFLCSLRQKSFVPEQWNGCALRCSPTPQTMVRISFLVYGWWFQ